MPNPSRAVHGSDDRDEVRTAQEPPGEVPSGTTRRAVVGGALGALVGLAASALGQPSSVLGANGDPVILGHNAGNTPNTATVVTQVGVATQGETALLGESSNVAGAGIGVRGTTPSPLGVGVQGDAVSGKGIAGLSEASVGVYGHSNGSAGSGGRGVEGAAPNGFGVVGSSSTATGIYGSSDQDTGIYGGTGSSTHAGMYGRSTGGGCGVFGLSGSTLPTAPAKTGIYGEATQDSASRGVRGKSTTGQGVRGEASTGEGVYGVASNAAGYALRGSGRVRFDKVSGLATLAAGTKTKTITPGTDITTDSFVLLTPMTDIGSRRLWFTRDTTNDRITIHMSSSRSSSTSIAWLLVG